MEPTTSSTASGLPPPPSSSSPLHSKEDSILPLPPTGATTPGTNPSSPTAAEVGVLPQPLVRTGSAIDDISNIPNGEIDVASSGFRMPMKPQDEGATAVSIIPDDWVHPDFTRLLSSGLGVNTSEEDIGSVAAVSSMASGEAKVTSEAESAAVFEQAAQEATDASRMWNSRVVTAKKEIQRLTERIEQLTRDADTANEALSGANARKTVVSGQRTLHQHKYSAHKVDTSSYSRLAQLLRLMQGSSSSSSGPTGVWPEVSMEAFLVTLRAPLAPFNLYLRAFPPGVAAFTGSKLAGGASDGSAVQSMLAAAAPCVGLQQTETKANADTKSEDTVVVRRAIAPMVPFAARCLLDESATEGCNNPACMYSHPKHADKQAALRVAHLFDTICPSFGDQRHRLGQDTSVLDDSRVAIAVAEQCLRRAVAAGVFSGQCASRFDSFLVSVVPHLAAIGAHRTFPGNHVKGAAGPTKRVKPPIDALASAALADVTVLRRINREQRYTNWSNIRVDAIGDEICEPGKWQDAQGSVINVEVMRARGRTAHADDCNAIAMSTATEEKVEGLVAARLRQCAAIIAAEGPTASRWRLLVRCVRAKASVALFAEGAERMTTTARAAIVDQVQSVIERGLQLFPRCPQLWVQYVDAACELHLAAASRLQIAISAMGALSSLVALADSVATTGAFQTATASMRAATSFVLTTAVFSLVPRHPDDTRKLLVSATEPAGKIAFTTIGLLNAHVLLAALELDLLTDPAVRANIPSGATHSMPLSIQDMAGAKRGGFSQHKGAPAALLALLTAQRWFERQVAAGMRDESLKVAILAVERSIDAVRPAHKSNAPSPTPDDASSDCLPPSSTEKVIMSGGDDLAAAVVTVSRLARSNLAFKPSAMMETLDAALSRATRFDQEQTSSLRAALVPAALLANAAASGAVRPVGSSLDWIADNAVLRGLIDEDSDAIVAACAICPDKVLSEAQGLIKGTGGSAAQLLLSYLRNPDAIVAAALNLALTRPITAKANTDKNPAAVLTTGLEVVTSVLSAAVDALVKVHKKEPVWLASRWMEHFDDFAMQPTCAAQSGVLQLLRAVPLILAGRADEDVVQVRQTLISRAALGWTNLDFVLAAMEEAAKGW